MKMRDLLQLKRLEFPSDAALLLLRLLTGGFLVWEMWPNVSSQAEMVGVVGYFESHGFIYPEFFAPLSAWAQFVIGIALLLGLATRWAGILLAFNFVVGMIMVHLDDSFRDQWPALALLATGLLFATLGAGRYGIDRAISSRLITLPRLADGADAALLATRLLTGAFLIHGVWDNIVSPDRMAEFVGFLDTFGFPAPALMAPLSVYAQFLIGLALIPGFLTRWAGLLLMVNFIVAWLMVHSTDSLRAAYPALVLIGFGGLFATVGAGRYAIDSLLSRRRPH
jgi:putative oxidoreductase